MTAKKYTAWAIGLSFLAGSTCLGMFFILTILSFFGNGNFAGYIARFLFLGAGYIAVGIGFAKQRPWAARLGIAIVALSSAVFVLHYTFVTGKPVNYTVIATRIFWHAPLLIAYSLCVIRDS